MYGKLFFIQRLRGHVSISTVAGNHALVLEVIILLIQPFSPDNNLDFGGLVATFLSSAIDGLG